MSELSRGRPASTSNNAKAPAVGRRLPLLWVAPIALAGLVVRLTAGPHPVDDAFITFRYALNLVDGRGLVYNPGEFVLGTSAPLYAVLLAAAAKLTGSRSFPDLALWINSLADSVSIGLVFLILRRLRLAIGPAILASLLVALSPFTIRYSIGGMETSVLTLVCLLSALLFLRGHRLAPYHLAGLAAGLRPDALAYGAALLIGETWRIRRVPWRSLAVIAAWTGLGMLLLWVSYGEPLPHSVLAKAHQVYRVDPGTNFLQHVFLFSSLSLTGARGFGARGLVVSPSPALNVLALVGFLPLAALWAMGAVREARDEPHSSAFSIYLVIFTSVYSLLGLRGSLMAEWYLVPLVPFWLIPLFSGLAVVDQGVQRASMRGLVWALPLALLVIEVASLNLGRDETKPATLPLNVWVEREELYLQAADFLKDSASEDSLVAASEIGALGYACECRILDTVGLVSPSVSTYYPLPEESLVGNYAVPTELILSHKPDYLVSLEIFLRNTLLKDETFLSEYREVWRAQTDAFGSRGLLIFRKTAKDPED